MRRQRLAPVEGNGSGDTVAQASFVGSLRARLGPHFGSTASASLYMYIGRAAALLWALFLVHHFGVSQYGMYAIAFAVSAMVSLPADAYFAVRVPRVADSVFLGERSTRAIMAVGFAIVGAIVWPFSLLAGLALVKAGTDIGFNAVRSKLVRDGQPHLAQRGDAFRQTLGAVAGVIFVLAANSETIEAAAVVYLAGCTVPVLLTAVRLKFARPVGPTFDGSMKPIMVESVGGVAYVQLDVILLGSLASTTVAGYYSFASLVVWSLAAVGQNYGFTFHRKLRASGGASSSGPRFIAAVWLGAITGTFVVLAGLALLVGGAPVELWLTFVLLGPVSFTRTISSAASTILVMRSLDHLRMKVTVVSVVVKIAGLMVLGHYGGIGAAIAFLLSDLVMTSIYVKNAFFTESPAVVEPAATDGDSP